MKKAQTRSKQVKKVETEIAASGTPLMTTTASVRTPTRTRRNKSATIERTDRFHNIDSGMIPFHYSTSSYGDKTSSIDIRDTVMLCQKAYYNFAIFRNTIDLMTEFSCSRLFLRGGSKKSKEFFNAFFLKTNLWDLQDRFFREYYRSGNVFLYRFDGKIAKKDLNKMTQTFGVSKANTEYSIPIRYCILNPADVHVGGNISFAAGTYYKQLSGYELERLRSPRTEEDREVLNSLDPEIQKKIKERVPHILMPLDANRINAVFYKKMDYEPFAVPMGYPVLEDINWKAEMKKMDMAIARTMQQTVLLVTMGAEPEKGGINQKNLAAMQSLFANESVGRVLIADYTTKAEFVIPKVGSILDPKKFEVVNKDIEIGLNSIVTGGGEKFANQNIKVELFIARLRQARETFLNQFLIPEIKRVAKSLGFKNYPTPYFHKLSIKNDETMSRIYARLVEVGVLTAEEGMEALDTGKLPSPEESKISQQEYNKMRGKGFYEPLMGGPETQKVLADKTGELQLEVTDKNIKSQEKISKEKAKEAAKKPAPGAAPPAKSGSKGPAGRPSGTKSPQTTKKVSPIGANENYILSDVKDNFVKADKLYKKVQASLKRKHKVKELSEPQKDVAFEITKTIVANENPESWDKKAKDYIKNPVDTNPDRIREIQEIAYAHQVDDYLASILYISKA
jgi:hypothetical protein